jgi:O-antigen ligase
MTKLPQLDWYDRLGVALATTFAAWTVISGVARSGNPWPQVALIVATAATYVVARTKGSHHLVFVASAIVVAIVIAVALSGRGAFFGGPLAPPLGYANANGALYVLGAAAAAIVATFGEGRAQRWLGRLLSIVMLVLAIVTMSKAAIVLAVVILVAAASARALGRWVALVAPAVVLGAVATTVLLGATHGAPILHVLEEGLTERRTTLWHEALDIVSTEPVFGVGPGDFANTSPTALADVDALWAHSAYLEVAAETGVVGLLLLVALIGWTYGALYRSRQDTRLVVIATAAVTALAVHAAIDYVIHFPSVVLIAAILVGLATGQPSRSGNHVHSSPP